MKRLGIVLLACVLLGALYLIAWPVPIDPVAWNPPPAPELAGPYAPNTLLAGVERLPAGGTGPEAIVIGPNGQIYTGLEDGRIVRMDEDGAGHETFADTGGRPLGMKFDGRGNLIVGDSIKGLLSVDPDGAITVLSTGANKLPFHFVDDLVIASYGTIYFTDASWKFGEGEHMEDLLEHRGNGRLLAYSPARQQTQVLLSGLQFANGVALAPDESFVLVNETGAFRTRRVWLTGAKAGEVDTFIENLPGYPDNITSNGIDTFWLALASPRNVETEERLAPNPFLIKLIMRLPESVRPGPENYAFVLGLDVEGRVMHNLQDPSPDCYGQITSAVEYDGTLYLGSLTGTDIARLPVPEPNVSPAAISAPAPILEPAPPEPAEPEPTPEEVVQEVEQPVEPEPAVELPVMPTPKAPVPEPEPVREAPAAETEGAEVLHLYTEDAPTPPSAPEPFAPAPEPESSPEADAPTTPDQSGDAEAPAEDIGAESTPEAEADGEPS